MASTLHCVSRGSPPIAASRSATLLKTPRRMASWVIRAMKRSTKLSQDEEVGMKCRLKRLCRFNHFCTSATAKSIELILKSESFSTYTTDLGEEGIDLGKLYDYDIILLDLSLPDMSGYEVLRKLRVSKVKTPILILS